MLQKLEICNSLMDHLTRKRTLPSYVYMNCSIFSRLRFTLNIQSVLGIGNRCGHNIVLVIQWKQRRIYDCVTSIRLLSQQKGSIIILDWVKCCEILFTYFALTYQSFAYLRMVHCYMAWSLCWIQNIAPHHETEGDWCKCGIALAVQLHKSHYTHSSLHRRSIRHW